MRSKSHGTRIAFTNPFLTLGSFRHADSLPEDLLSNKFTARDDDIVHDDHTEPRVIVLGILEDMSSSTPRHELLHFL